MEKIALTLDFQDALGKLTKEEAKQALKVIRSITKNSDANGLRFHKIDHPCGNIVSYSVNMDIRVIAYRENSYTTFLYIGHHDDAYNWTKNRNFFHPPNDIIRIVTSIESEPPTIQKAINDCSRQKMQKIVSPKITSEMVEGLRRISSEVDKDDKILEYINNQPEELHDNLLDLVFRVFKAQSCKISNRYEVKVITDDSILEDALKYPLEKWRVFLHPKQEKVISEKLNKSVLLTGAPGTGKTVCLVHKAKVLATQINSGECILISTFKDTLKDYLLKMLHSLSYDREKIFIVDISTLNQIGENQLTENLDGFFKQKNNKLYYYKKNTKYEVKHILFDEYQDFGNGLLSRIEEMTRIVPFTISYDYSQSIYKQIRRTTDSLEEKGIRKHILNYSYRVNSRILVKLQKIIRLISILVTEDVINGGISEEEKKNYSKYRIGH